MSLPPPAPAPALAQPAALAAFLRGVDRRAAVFAELQTGAPSVGDAALTRAMSSFREQATDTPMADWPRLFWSTLLAQPALRTSRAATLDGLPAASPALRAALLLRVAAGLDEPAAAAVLGVAPELLREAVLRALPRTPDGAPDAAVWNRLQRDVQARIRDLPATRSLHLARIREGALAGPAERFFARPVDRRPRRVAVAVAAVGVALLATRWWGGVADGPIRVVPLPPAGDPASRYGRDAGLIAHPDFELLADPAAERLARDAAFLSWTVGRSARPATLEPAPVDDVPETSGAADAP